MKTPIELVKVTKSVKVSPASWERAGEVAERLGATIGDVVSICLSYMSEDEIGKVLIEQREAVNALPKSVRGLLANVHKLDADQKEMLREILSKG